MAGLRSRVAFAIVGTIVLAGAGAVVGARSVLPNDQAAAAVISASQDPTATSIIAQPTATSVQEATPTPRAQPTARPTATPGGVVTVSCTITSVTSSAGRFICRNSSGVTKTVVTNGQTQFTGAATQFSGLRAGLRARNTGSY
jgi:hypothetical protein